MKRFFLSLSLAFFAFCPLSVRALVAIEAALLAPDVSCSPGGAASTVIAVDPRYLSFDYRINSYLFQNNKWIPTRVCDDGQKMYVIFPEFVLQNEMPAVFGDHADVLDYRVHENVMIIDRLVEKISIRLADSLFTVEKKNMSLFLFKRWPD